MGWGGGGRSSRKFKGKRGERKDDFKESVRAQGFYLFSVIKIKIVLKSGENKQKITKKKSNISPEVDKKHNFLDLFQKLSSFLCLD